MSSPCRLSPAVRIAAVALADRVDKIAVGGWTADSFLREVDRPFREVVTGENLRNEWLVRAAGGRYRSRSASEEWRVRPSPRATAVSSARCSPASTQSRCARVTAV